MRQPRTAEDSISPARQTSMRKTSEAGVLEKLLKLYEEDRVSDVDPGLWATAQIDEPDAAALAAEGPLREKQLPPCRLIDSEAVVASEEEEEVGTPEETVDAGLEGDVLFVLKEAARCGNASFAKKRFCSTDEETGVFFTSAKQRDAAKMLRNAGEDMPGSGFCGYHAALCIEGESVANQSPERIASVMEDMLGENSTSTWRIMTVATRSALTKRKKGLPHTLWYISRTSGSLPAIL
eukprot:GHVS01045559.1.p1 GENE.GHVS01045559.1~~GHVS01045559.1.p1  ORF type:complete len:237 (+),score=29.26 GHVS01045559.1:127-837(+)